MEPDFYRQYQDLTVNELVKVARTPDEYLPEAVAAAERILRERGISREEMAAEEWLIAQKEMVDGLRKEQRSDVRAWVGELFGQDRLGMLPGNAERWYLGLLLLYGIYYLYNIFLSIRTIVWWFYSDYPLSFLLYNVVWAVYITATLYCILRQLFLGWSLVVIQLAFLFGSLAAMIFHCYSHHYFPHMRFSYYLYHICYISLAIILWRPHMKATFKINAASQSKTLLAAALAGLVSFVFFNI